jgi:hypothetical protein
VEAQWSFTNLDVTHNLFYHAPSQARGQLGGHAEEWAKGRGGERGKAEGFGGQKAQDI